ncbi:MAG: hypothetical protein IJY81_04990 [Lachnospiraceae bacterium]|nr:hypothetical protein [Lachnospira sp.]MBQ8730521.1 hypothetical protein [Lachnospiraceae bacterium]
MNKKYIICYFAIAASALLAFIIGYYFMAGSNRKNETNNGNLQQGTLKSLVVNESPSMAITTRTNIVCEKYYMNSSKIEKGEITEFNCLGLTKSGLQEKIDNYLMYPSANDLSDGLVAFEIIEFNNMQVTLRKTYNKIDNNSVGDFYLTEENGFVVIYLADKKTLYDYTGISLSQLPQELKNEVKKGKYITGIEALYEFLENYSS